MYILNEVNRILIPGGKMILGLGLKESPWRQFYQLKKARGHRFCDFATFYTYDEVGKLLEQVGLSVEKVVSRPFQQPGKVEQVEEPQEDYFPDARFTVVVGSKQGAITT